MKTLLFNPFIKIAGFKALGIGILLMLAAAALAACFNARFDGVLDVHFTSERNLMAPFIDQLIIILVLVVVFYSAGLISGARPRLTDIAGTFALARFPYTLAPFMNINGSLSGLSESLKNSRGNVNEWPFNTNETIALIVPSVFGILLAAWMVVLYLNAYKVSTNLKGNKLVLGFISGLLLAEILSVYLIRSVFYY